jgi:hypothetical protein
MSFKHAIFFLVVGLFLVPIQKSYSQNWCSEYFSVTSEYDFTISEDTVKSQTSLNWDLINSTLFVVPDNDGEARRALSILKSINAPYVIRSKQRWGATLDKEKIDIELLQKMKSVAIFEIPGLYEENQIRELGPEVIILDHHKYANIDRRQPLSSLEQLAELIGWRLSDLDYALAVNDRGYIPGLRKLNLNEAQIYAIRVYDLIAQGLSLSEVLTQIRNAKALIPGIQKMGSIFLLPEAPGIDEGILKQELAILSSDGMISALLLNNGKIGFTGDPKIVQKLLEFDFTTLGFRPGTYSQYGGGDPDASMFFGFKPKEPHPESPTDEFIPIPDFILENIKALIESWSY